MKLILLRHGESQWNLENRFTGWKDVSLTELGIQEAISSANNLIKKNIQISTVQTSILKRAIDTAKIVAELIKFPTEKIQYDWRLNERHYGALEGLNKSETATKYGEDQVKNLPKTDLVEKILTEYIGKKVMALEIEKLGIFINDKALVNIIKNYKIFFKKKKF